MNQRQRYEFFLEKKKMLPPPDEVGLDDIEEDAAE